MNDINSTSSSGCDQISSREIQLTWTILLVCLCYLVCVSPMVICYMIDSHTEHGGLLLGLNCLYWLQYSLNFFIYAFRSEQFRKAYLDLFATAWKAAKQVNERQKLPI